MWTPIPILWVSRKYHWNHAAVIHLKLIALIALRLSSAPTQAATSVVTSLSDSDPGSLRQTIANATPGDAIVFNVVGTITLTGGELVLDKNLTIIGPGASNLTISGNNTSRVLAVEPDVVLTAVNLTIAHGMSTNGGGIYNEDGTVTLSNVVLEANVATNASGDACGGAVFNTAVGKLDVINCTFEQNAAHGASGHDATSDPSTDATSGSRGRGGAVFSIGTLTASRCTFAQNLVQGGTGGSGLCFVEGYHGPSHCFNGAEGSSADGSAICSLGEAMIEQCLVVSNTAAGGNGGLGAAGAANEQCGEVTSGSSGSAGGDANGGALFIAGPTTLLNSTLALNIGYGGVGGSGGNGVDFTCHGPGHTVGGQGGDGGAAFGVIFDDYAALEIMNCTLAENTAIGGSGGDSGGGGFRLFYPPDDPGNPVYSIFPAPPAGSPGTGAGVLIANGNSLNSLFVSNSPFNCRGGINDRGHNISSDGSCAFTNTGSLNDTDSMLAPLADNGGATLTMALLSGSPALDAADTVEAPATDQRGQLRPCGPAVDIGAYEYQGAYPEWLLSYDLPTDGSMDDSDTDGDGLSTWQEWRCRTCPTSSLSALRLLSAKPEENIVCVSWQSVTDVSYFLERCTNLSSSIFEPVATNISGQLNSTTFTDTNAPGSSLQLYRVGVGN